MENLDSNADVQTLTETTVSKPVKTRKTKQPKAEKATPSSVTAAKLEAAPAKKKNYLNNADLMKQIALSREQDKMTDELANMLTVLCTRYAKHPDYSGIYSYDEDMKAFAMLTAVRVWRSFNPERSNNPFAYFTQIFRHAFYQYLNHETRQRVIKDEVLVNMGELPSFSYMENYHDEIHDERFGYDGDDNDDEPRKFHGDDPTAPSPVREIDYTKGVIEDGPSDGDIDSELDN